MLCNVSFQIRILSSWSLEMKLLEMSLNAGMPLNLRVSLCFVNKLILMISGGLGLCLHQTCLHTGSFLFSWSRCLTFTLIAVRSAVVNSTFVICRLDNADFSACSVLCWKVDISLVSMPVQRRCVASMCWILGIYSFISSAWLDGR